MDDLLWHCTDIEGRPNVACLPVLQSRLGWPMGIPSDVTILEWHVQVRAVILRDRYS